MVCAHIAIITIITIITIIAIITIITINRNHNYNRNRNHNHVISTTLTSPNQLRNLERAFSRPDGRAARVADRAALIIDIFSQRARTQEAMLQVCGRERMVV